MNADAVCPCGRSLAYARCCAPLHQGQPATSAEDLMRSRYSAYCLRLADYLLSSWDPDSRPHADSLQPSLDPALRWLGLDIRSCRQLDHESAEVEFVARSRRGGAAAERHHEISRFRLSAGRWYYVSGRFVERSAGGHRTLRPRQPSS